MSKTPITKPLSKEELRKQQENDGHITAVIAIPWDEVGTIEQRNDEAECQITDGVIPLSDIEYELVGCDIPNSTIWLQVTASIEDWLDAHIDEEDD